MGLPRFNHREPGVWLSGLAHVGLLTAGLVAYTAAPLPESQEGIPVEVITDAPSEIPKGETSATEVKPNAQERADKEADTKVVSTPGETPNEEPPLPPTRPADMKEADEDAVPPPPPARPNFEKAEAEAAKAAAAAKAAEAAKAEAAKAAATKAAAAKAAAAKEAAAKEAAIKTAQREEAEERAEAEREAAEAKEQAAKAKAAAKARADAKAKADAEKAEADAEAKAALQKKLAEAEKAEQAKAEQAKAAQAKAAQEKAAREAKAAEERRKVADAKAKADAKARADAKAKADADAKARRQAQAAERFNPGDISRLVGTAPPQGSGSTGRQVQRTASLGTASGQGAKLTPSERDQIVGIINEQLHRCWQVPLGADGADKPPNPVVNVRIAPDGSLQGEPTVQNSSGHKHFRTVADAAIRATRRCTPLRIPAKFAAAYDVWKQLNVSYNVRD